MIQMTSREHVIAGKEITGPDRVPFKHCVLPASFRAHPKLPDLLAPYPSDFEGENGRPTGYLNIPTAKGKSSTAFPSLCYSPPFVPSPTSLFLPASSPAIL